MGVGRLLGEIVAITITAIPLALSMWALLDCARRPAWAWALCGRNRAGWMAAILLGILSLVGGLVVSCWYLVRVRPVVAAAEDGRITAPPA